jgi:hypothetical protein
MELELELDEGGFPGIGNLAAPMPVPSASEDLEGPYPVVQGFQQLELG